MLFLFMKYLQNNINKLLGLDRRLTDSLVIQHEQQVNGLTWKLRDKLYIPLYDPLYFEMTLAFE